MPKPRSSSKPKPRPRSVSPRRDRQAQACIGKPRPRSAIRQAQPVSSNHHAKIQPKPSPPNQTSMPHQTTKPISANPPRQDPTQAKPALSNQHASSNHQARIGKPTMPRSNHHTKIEIGANPSRFQPPQRGTEGKAEKETKNRDRSPFGNEEIYGELSRKQNRGGAEKEKEMKREKKID